MALDACFCVIFILVVSVVLVFLLIFRTVEFDGFFFDDWSCFC